MTPYRGGTGLYGITASTKLTRSQPGRAVASTRSKVPIVVRAIILVLLAYSPGCYYAAPARVQAILGPIIDPPARLTRGRSLPAVWKGGHRDNSSRPRAAS